MKFTHINRVIHQNRGADDTEGDDRGTDDTEGDDRGADDTEGDDRGADDTEGDDNLRLMTAKPMTPKVMTAERIKECCLRCYVRWKDLRR